MCVKICRLLHAFWNPGTYYTRKDGTRKQLKDDEHASDGFLIDAINNYLTSRAQAHDVLVIITGEHSALVGGLISIVLC